MKNLNHDRFRILVFSLVSVILQSVLYSFILLFIVWKCLIEVYYLLVSVSVQRWCYNTNKPLVKTVILCTKAFVGDDNFKTQTSWMHHWGLILARSSKWTVVKSWRFCGPLLWTLTLSSFHIFSTGFRSGDWLGHSSSFIFFLSNQLRVSLAVFRIFDLLSTLVSFS